MRTLGDFIRENFGDWFALVNNAYNFPKELIQVVKAETLKNKDQFDALVSKLEEAGLGLF
jgi:hypothetical protein